MHDEHDSNEIDDSDDGDNRDGDGEGGIDPTLVAILEQLWRAHRETPDREWSLAKLSKQAGVPMSGLRRHLTALVDSGLVVTTLSEDGTGRASLSDDGRTFCAEVFGQAAP